MKIRAFITHKVKEKFTDCQDRFSINPDTKSVAVSDGMSQSWQQKIWAQLLVDTFANSCEWLPTHESIKPLCYKWREEVERFIQNLKDNNAPENLIYRNERNLAEKRSAGATFVGIRFIGMNWSGIVLGDSCLIEWDGENTIFHTSQHTDSFDNRPDFFDSNPLCQGKGTHKNINGTISDNSVILLVSDPFSDFLFEHSKQGDVATYIHQLLNIASHEVFETVVEEWRKNGMHNDDTTLIIIENDNSEDITINHPDDIAEMIEKEKFILTIEKEASKELEENKIGSSVTEKAIDKLEQDVTTEDTNPPTIPVNADTFIKFFLNEYKSILENKCKGTSQKEIKKFLGKLKYETTQKAAEEALRIILKKYIIHAR